MSAVAPRVNACRSVDCRLSFGFDPYVSSRSPRPPEAWALDLLLEKKPVACYGVQLELPPWRLGVFILAPDDDASIGSAVSTVVCEDVEMSVLSSFSPRRRQYAGLGLSRWGGVCWTEPKPYGRARRLLYVRMLNDLPSSILTLSAAIGPACLV